MTDNKTIAVTLRFWTNDLNVMNNGHRIACWDSGTALLEANKEKKIKSATEVINCPEDILPAIRKLFRKRGILVVSGGKKPRIC